MDIDLSEIRIMVRVATQRTGTPVHDEDLEQDAMLKALQACRRQREIRHPRAFLMKIVRDVVRDHWRRRRNLDELDVVAEIRFAHLPCFEADLDRKRETELLREALLQIGRDKNVTLELFYRENQSIREIARRQNKSASAVKMQLVRARRSLAEIVSVLSARNQRSANLVRKNEDLKPE